MKKSAEIKGLPIISISEGRELGVSRSLVVDTAKGRVAAVAMEDEKWYLGAKLLAFESIAAIGTAITINSSQDILELADTPELEKLLENDTAIIGSKVITKAGRIMGVISEIIIADDGAIAVCLLETVRGELRRIPAQHVVTFGKDVTVVSDSREIEESANMAGEAAGGAADAPERKHEAPHPKAGDPAASRNRLLGRKVSRRLETAGGTLIVDEGGEVTEEVLQKARLAGKFDELAAAFI